MLQAGHHHRPTLAALARHAHYRIRQPHSHVSHRALSWPYRGLFGDVAATATIFDSTDPTKLPGGGAGALAYMDGLYANLAAVRALYSVVKTVTCRPSSPANWWADIIDCERGNPNAQQSAQWAYDKLAHEMGRPCIYCGTAIEGDPDYDLPGVQAAVEAMGLHVGDVDYFVADYDNLANLAIPAGEVGVVGKQYASNDAYDTSIVLASWLDGTTPTPAPMPPPTQEDYENMLAVSPVTKVACATDPEGNFYGNGAVQHVVTLALVRAKYGGAAGTMFEPCVGLLFEVDPPGTPTAGQWGYTYVCKPGNPVPTSRLGPFTAYHINADGTY